VEPRRQSPALQIVTVYVLAPVGVGLVIALGDGSRFDQGARESSQRSSGVSVCAFDHEGSAALTESDSVSAG
jgi:hypothetical protein